MLKFLFATLLATVGFAQYDSLQAQGWVRLTTGVSAPLVSLFVVNPDTVYVSSPGVLLRTVNGGNTWDQLEIDAETAGSLWFVDDSTGFFAGQTDKIFKTTDGGEHWVAIATGLEQNYVDQMQFVGRDTGWVLGAAGTTFLRTTDRGEHWNRIELHNSVQRFSFATNAIGYTTDVFDDSLMKTSDGGSSWRFVKPGRRVPYHIAISPDTVIAIHYSAGFLRSVDSGMTWQAYSMLGYQTIDLDFAPNHRDGWAVWRSILHTTDGGESWDVQVDRPQAVLKEVRAASPMVAYAVGDSGVVMKTSNGGQSWVNISPGGTNALNASCYPSPTRDETLVSYRLETADRISLSIVDGQGKTEMTVPDQDVQSSGPHSVRLDLSGLPSGAYTVQISGAHTRGAAKLAVVR